MRHSKLKLLLMFQFQPCSAQIHASPQHPKALEMPLSYYEYSPMHDQLPLYEQMCQPGILITNAFSSKNEYDYFDSKCVLVSTCNKICSL